MNQEADVIVVGAGLAGLTAAAFLAKAGQRVLVHEKGRHPGGLVRTFIHQGFAFDAGIRAFENSGIILPMLKSLGIELPNVRNAVSIGIAGEWARLEDRGSLADYSALLVRLFPEESAAITVIADEIRQVMKYMDVLYGIDNPLFREDFRDLGYVTKTLLPWLARYQVNIRKATRLNLPVNDHLRQFTRNQALIDMITQHFFRDTPTFFALSYFGLYLDYRYPLGGMGSLADAMVGFIKAHGGEIRTGSQVTEVDAESRRIRTADGEGLAYRQLIWAADQKQLYAALVAPESDAILLQSQLVETAEGGDSVLTLYLGVDLDPGYFRSRTGAHAFYTPATEGLTSLGHWQSQSGGGDAALLDWTRAYLGRTTYEISIPCLRDPSLAPEGQTGIIVSTLLDYRLVRRFADSGQEDRFRAVCVEAILSTLEDSVFPGFAQKIRFALPASPVTIERETGNAQGAITGWSFTNPVIPAESRFPRITDSVLTPIPHILQCGQWTFSPSGLPVAILTGKLAADAAGKSLAGRRS